MARKKQITVDDAKAELWRQGILEWKLRGVQKSIYENIVNDTDRDTRVILCSRRLGKSFTLLLYAFELCIKIPNAIVKYACPEQKMVGVIIRDNARELLKDCPSELKPKWMTDDKCFRFPNGSEVQIAGVDTNAEGLRGGKANALIVDEAAFCNDLTYVVNSIMLPTTDTTGGKLILASTPNPKNIHHEFHTYFITQAEADNSLVKYTLYDSPMVTEKEINRIVKRYPGGVNDPAFRCEYLCEIPRSTELSIVPEFTEELKKQIVIDEYSLPKYTDFYVSMDVGFKDLTVVLFGYYDFEKARLVIQDELVMNGLELTTDKLAKEIRYKESERFVEEEFNVQLDPFKRISDIDLRLINDLQRIHGLTFYPTGKDSLDAMVNQMRLWLTSDRVRIHSRCKHLLYHLQYGSWNNKRTKFKHLPDIANGSVRGGHVDSIPALYYLIRGINEYKNPFPDNYGKHYNENTFFSSNFKQQSNSWSEFSKSLNKFVKK